MKKLLPKNNYLKDNGFANIIIRNYNLSKPFFMQECLSGLSLNPGLQVQTYDDSFGIHLWAQSSFPTKSHASGSETISAKLKFTYWTHE